MKKKKPTYHIVSHSHWDREWYFPFDRFRAMLVDMIEDLLGIFERDKEFRSYTLDGQMAAVLDYLEVRPDRKDRIKKLVQQKKLFIGPWYILNDEFLASGESQIRNLQFGFRLGAGLGGVMKMGYIPDQFSHIAQMPQLLRGFGLDTAMFYRGFGGEKGQEPSEYWWVSPDGSRVLLHHMPKDGYSAGYFGTNDEEIITQKFERIRKELDARASTSQRLFFNGGDHHWPDADVTTAIKVLRKKYGAVIVHSNFPDYFAALKRELGKAPKLPNLQGETRFGYRHAYAVLGGVFSSRIYLKQMNVQCQILIERFLEPMNVLSLVRGARSKTPQIEQAWKYVIQNQDHDAICGTSTDEVHREMVVRFEKAKQIGAFVTHECSSALLPYDERAKQDDRFLFVFNPSPFQRSDIVEASVDFYLQDVLVGLNPDVQVSEKLPPAKSFRLVDGDGNEVEYDILKREEAFGITYSKHDYPGQTLVDRFAIVLRAENIPALGWKGYKILKNEKPRLSSNGLTAGENFLENDFLRVDVRQDGSIDILDKQSDLRYGPLNIFENTGDVGDEYNYSYPDKDEAFRSTQSTPSLRLLEHSALRGSLSIEYRMELPASAAPGERSRSQEKILMPVTTVVSLTPYARRVDIRTTVDNTVKDHRLRALFSTGIDTIESYADTPFAVVRREHRAYDVSQFAFEHPALVAAMQRFVTIHDGEKGMTLMTKGLPEYELSLQERGTLTLTLLRCVGKLSGRDLITRPGGAAGWWTETPEAQCPGIHTFEYSLFPHAGKGDEFWPSVIHEVECYTVTPATINRKNEQARLDESFFSLEPAGLQLSALKEAEDGKGIVVRISNPVDRTVRALVKTHRPVIKANRCRLDEKNLQPVRVIKKYTLAVPVRPFEIVSLRIRFGSDQPRP